MRDEPAAPQASRLGFGCSRLVGGLSKDEARYLVDAAWDNGIRP